MVSYFCSMQSLRLVVFYVDVVCFKFVCNNEGMLKIIFNVKYSIKKKELISFYG